MFNPASFLGNAQIQQTQQQNRRQANPANSLVTVPTLNNEIIQTVLDINKTLIKILVEYQNNGWLEESMQFHNRLQTNLTYLATVADYVTKPGARGIPEPPDLNPIQWPQKLQNLSNNSQIINQNNSQSFAQIPSTLTQAIESIAPPPMVIDTHPASSELPKNYIPVPPFYIPREMKQAAPQGVEFKEDYASTKTATYNLMQRLDVVGKDENIREDSVRPENDYESDGDEVEQENDDEYRPGMSNALGNEALNQQDEKAYANPTSHMEDLDYFQFIN